MFNDYATAQRVAVELSNMNSDSIGVLCLASWLELMIGALYFLVALQIYRFVAERYPTRRTLIRWTGAILSVFQSDAFFVGLVQDLYKYFPESTQGQPIDFLHHWTVFIPVSLIALGLYLLLARDLDKGAKIKP